ncbi:MATE family efflux transporter [Fusibacter ferrireducens]|uniref:Probable multidrug resistance protein NorM n=1 Tax=Fusibacter ferrireducens TaxID=2785058 RepID=A0ABR9ZXL3_9FIRM|nr:MATE family efflux transporter [Fusibacter ferrireducens]MBF4695106.1 MATE family efflux transporter [Fusibacter ferrireducens]
MSEVNKRINLTEGSIIHNLLKMSIPIMGTSFMQMAYNMIDMIWIGILGSKAVAAVGIAGFYVWFSFAFVLLSKTGTEIKVAQATGAGKDGDAERYARSGFQVIFMIGIVYTLVLIWFNNGLIGFFNTKDFEVETMSKLYLVIIAFGMVFSFSNQVFTGIFNGRGDSKSPFKINATGLMVNIILDPILILGFGPIPAFGVAGAAVATVFAQCVVFLQFICSIKFKHRLFQQFTFIKKPDFKSIESIVMMGVPPGLQSGLFTFISMFIARMIAVYGATPIAVQKVGSQIEAITWMTAGGLAVALGAFVGQNYGAGQFRRVLEGYRKAMGVAICLGILNSILLFFGAKWLFMIFIREPVAISQGIDYLRILAVSQLFMCVEITASGAFNGIGNTKPAAITSIIFNLMRIPFAYYLSTQTPLGLNGIWWAISISSIFKGIIIFTWFRMMIRKSPEFANAI